MDSKSELGERGKESNQEHVVGDESVEVKARRKGQTWVLAPELRVRITIDGSDIHTLDVEIIPA